MNAETLAAVISHLDAAKALLKAEHAGVEVDKIAGVPPARVLSVGESAHLHLGHIESHGSCTLADSIAIRRKLYGAKVRSTANQFGTKGSGAILYRDVPFGTKTSGDDEVRLTDTGVKIAKAFRLLHGI